jgi:hypothetical protein
MMIPRIKTVFLLTVFFLYSNCGWGADKDMYPGMLALGPFDFIPLLSLEEKYDDNIFHNKFNQKSSLITQIQGGGEIALRRKFDRYALNYNFLSSQYHQSADDDFIDHTLGINTHVEANIRNRFDLVASVHKGHNMRGTFFTEGAIATQLSEPDQFHQYDSKFTYRYGRVDAIGNLGLQLGWNQLEYDNHLDRTALWDRTQLELTPGFYLRVSPKTYLTAEMQNIFVEYTNASPQSYDKQRYLIGATWEQSSKTKGTIRAGYLQQEFTNSALPSQSDLTWDGKVQWSPLSYSHFTLFLSKDVQPSIGLSAASRQLQVYNASWQHEWAGRIITELSGGYQKAFTQATVGQVSNSAAGISSKIDVKYQMRTWMDVGINYSQSDFQGDTNNITSPKSVFMLYVHLIPHKVN